MIISARAAGIDGLKSLLYGMVMVVSLHGTNAFGAYITMATDFSVTVKAEELALVVTAENRGDVPAQEVQFEIIINDRVLTGPVVETLEQDKKMSAEFSLAAVPGIPGRYPVVMKTYYKDTSGHLFTALTVGFYNYKSTVIPAVSISGHAIRLPVEGKGRISFVLRNGGQTAQKIDLALLIPNELSTAHEHRVITIGPQQEATVNYDVENYSALANSSYPVSLLGQYEVAGNHVGIAGSAVVRIAGDVRPAVRLVWSWVLLGGLMPGVIIFLRRQKATGAGHR